MENILVTDEPAHPIDLRELHVVHFDDHTIFLNGIKMFFKKYFPNGILKSINTTEDLLYYLEYTFKNQIKIDLVIHDIKHPGLDGLHLSRVTKEISKGYKISLPILIISMYICESFSPISNKMIAERIWDKVLQKSASEIEIFEAIISLTD